MSQMLLLYLPSVSIILYFTFKKFLLDYISGGKAPILNYGYVIFTASIGLAITEYMRWILTGQSSLSYNLFGIVLSSFSFFYITADIISTIITYSMYSRPHNLAKLRSPSGHFIFNLLNISVTLIVFFVLISIL